MKKRNLLNTSLFMAVGIICMVMFGVQEVLAAGYCSVSSGVTISSDPVTLDSNFTISFTLKERNGTAKTFEKIAVAITRSDGSNVFDFAMYSNVTVSANGTWSKSATNKIYASNGAGTYKAVIRGKLPNDNWFDFDTVGSGVNPKSFTAKAVQPQPSSVSVSPSSGNWTSSPQYVSVSSSNASQIYYTIRYTTDGSTPSEPPEPTLGTNDGSISGASGNFQVYASAGQNKKLKVRFRGYNSIGYGSTTGSFSYAIDLRPPTPGSVTVNPTSGSWTSTPKYVNVNSSNASQIYYTIRYTTDGSTPSEPPEPTSTVNDGSISGASGNFQIYGSLGKYKQLKVRFRGYNSGGYGATTGSYSYSIDLRSSSTQLPGSVLVYPSYYSWTSSPKYVSINCSYASKIYYTIRYTTDGSIPSEPPEPTSTAYNDSITGSSGSFEVRANAGENKKLKVRFRGFNSSGYGATTASYLYSINLAQNQVADDYGNSCGNATSVNVNSTINGKIETAGDWDYFKVQVPSSGSLTVYTTGSTDTYGFLKNASCADIKSNDNYNGDNNFRISESVTAGTYYIAVRHYSSSETGNYTLYVSFIISGNDLDDGMMEVGVEWVNNYNGEGDLSNCDDDAEGFYNTMTNKGVIGRFNNGDNAAHYSHFTTNDANYVDNVDIVYFSGHGGVNENMGYIDFGDGYSATSAYMELGDKDLEWLVLSACLTLKNSGTVNVKNNWHNVFKGLHMILGFSSYSLDSWTTSEIGEDFADALMDGETVWEAWKDAAWDWIASASPIRLNKPACLSAETSSGSNNTVKNDHFWGKGTTVDDPYPFDHLCYRYIP